MAGFIFNPRGLKPVSRTGSALISPTTTNAYVDITNTLSLGNNEVVVLSPIAASQWNPTTMPGFINARGANTPITSNLTPTTQLNAFGVVAGFRYKISQYPGEIRSIYWKQGTNILPGTQVIAQIVNDPDIYFEVQVSSQIGLQQTDIGKYGNIGNINWIDGQPTTDPTTGAPVPINITQGQSYSFLTMALPALDPSPTASGGGLYDVQVVGLSPRYNNFFGTSQANQPNNYAIVKFNSYRDK